MALKKHLKKSSKRKNVTKTSNFRMFVYEKTPLNEAGSCFEKWVYSNGSGQ